MLIGLKEALEFGEKNNCGIASINTPTLEMLVATIKVAERHNIPLIIQHAEVHESVNTIENIGPAMVELAKRSSAPLVVHVDHGETFDYVKRGFDVGFNSAMYDGSRLPYEENLATTKRVVALANEYGYGIEAELGVMPGREDGADSTTGIGDESLYTDPDLAAEFVAQTGVTALACSFGTVHGLYKADPKINYELISTLRQRTGVPIVMHGGSGLSPAEYRECISRGVKKINYYTYADKAALEAVKQLLVDKPDTYVFVAAAVAAGLAIEKNIDTLVQCLYEGHVN
ncbi:class II fructose-bisphosphate aldolase [Propionicicella superfundia]|uniref:class II fructose-bisphosphate aldolase n=1 Tax=Propionicicella superfundia TaxID=348582 RepID=UPI00041CB98B|nr:class II fructose-bisphosphate aldolase [Propionicicella superfundia]